MTVVGKGAAPKTEGIAETKSKEKRGEVIEGGIYESNRGEAGKAKGNGKNLSRKSQRRAQLGWAINSG